MSDMLDMFVNDERYEMVIGT